MWRGNTGKTEAAPDGFVTAYYDGVQVLAHVLNNASDLSRDGVRASFLEVKGLETIRGTIEWDAPGDVKRPAPILVRLDDKGKLRKWE